MLKTLLVRCNLNGSDRYVHPWKKIALEEKKTKMFFSFFSTEKKTKIKKHYNFFFRKKTKIWKGKNYSLFLKS